MKIALALLATPFVLAGLPALFYRFLLWLEVDASSAHFYAVFAGVVWFFMWTIMIGTAVQFAHEERYYDDEEEEEDDDAERAP